MSWTLIAGAIIAATAYAATLYIGGKIHARRDRAALQRMERIYGTKPDARPPN